MSNKTTKRIPTVMLCLCALFAALLAVGAWIAIPVPSSGISFTLQLLAIMVCAALLPPVYASLSVIVYILLGIVGLPVFTGFNRGIGVLAGPTGGYIIGFIPAAFVTAWIIRKFGRAVWLQALAMVTGILICYAFGTVWFMISRKTALGVTLGWCVIPYLPFDAAKIAVSVALSKVLYKPMHAVLSQASHR